jgi:hypothetical protein
MFGLFKRKAAGSGHPSQGIRDTLFGDRPLDAWPSSDQGASESEPWSSFVKARDSVAAGRPSDAVAIWRSISEMRDLESRHYAQAWHFLRAQGVEPPPEIAKRLLGVVLEVPMHGGLDLLAAYSEHTARYYNYSGAGIVWEHPNDSLDGLIDALLESGRRILPAISPWKENRPTAPPAGRVRINLLAPSGLHFGEGSFQALAADPIAKLIMDVATVLMFKLTQIGKSL